MITVPVVATVDGSEKLSLLTIEKYEKHKHFQTMIIPMHLQAQQ
jgi:hypothetical protein